VKDFLVGGDIGAKELPVSFNRDFIVHFTGIIED